MTDSLLITFISLPNRLILSVNVGLGCRARRPGSRWMQSSTSSVRRSTRRTWRTSSERPPKELWPSIESKGTIRGRRNVSFCEVKRTKGSGTPPSCTRGGCRWRLHLRVVGHSEGQRCSVSCTDVETAVWFRKYSSVPVSLGPTESSGRLPLPSD